MAYGVLDVLGGVAVLGLDLGADHGLHRDGHRLDVIPGKAALMTSLQFSPPDYLDTEAGWFAKENE